MLDAVTSHQWQQLSDRVVIQIKQLDWDVFVVELSKTLATGRTNMFNYIPLNLTTTAEND